MEPYLNIAFVVVAGLLGVFGAGHALLNKRDPRGAAGWVVVCLSFPIFGALFYWLLGNNRIRTRAKQLQRKHDAQLTVFDEHEGASCELISGIVKEHFRNLVNLSASVSGESLTNDNRVQPLFNGEQAYPNMIDAINNAQSTVYLATYIFESRGVGNEFIEALASAVERGVKVRVLIDGVGDHYSFPRTSHLLKKKGVTVENFLPPRLLPPSLRINMRNHRKILAVDGRLAFTGGMNIRAKQTAHGAGWRGRILDVHFLLTGPVVEQIEKVFFSDWHFCHGETLEPSEVEQMPSPMDSSEDGSVDSSVVSPALCRVLVDGPNEDLDRLTWVLVGAISLAQQSIKIMTPYFIPSRELAIALQTAALRGVEVTIILPESNNLPFMKWASAHILGGLLRTGVRISFFQGPFLHSKLFMVDDYYVLVGSSNLDPRSLRLNFEIAVEVYDGKLAAVMADYFAESLAHSKAHLMENFKSRKLATRLRDGICWLFSPYL